MRTLGSILTAATAAAAFPAAAAESDAPTTDAAAIVTTVGTALFVVFAALIVLSVAAKLAIVFGLVPRTPATGFHRTVHGLAAVAGIFSGRRARIERRPPRNPDGVRRL